METNWLDLWRELAVPISRPPDSEMISRFKNHARKRSERPDSLLDYIIGEIDSETTIVDIGAGSGRWTIPLAAKAKSVTAIEPSESMRELLQENITGAGAKNIRIIQSSWEDASPGPHDIAVCAHAMYSSGDLASFVGKMEKHSNRACYLAVRLPPADGIIGQLSLSIYGRHHDSPNAVIAYNALYSLGIYPNMLMETGETYHWVNNTIDEAFVRAKRHMGLESNKAYDKLIRDTLASRLIRSNNTYIWPDGMHSALIWWRPGR